MTSRRASSARRALCAGGLAVAALAAASCGSSGDGGISCAADDVCQPRCAHDPDCAGAPGDAAADSGPRGQTDARGSSYPRCQDDESCPIGEFCYRDDLKCRPLQLWNACPRSPLACPGGAGDAGSTASTCLLTLLSSTFPLSYGDVCAPTCGDGGSCPAAPGGGTAVATCSASAGACVLDCAGGKTCPPGMTCSAVDSHCTWPEPGQ